MRPGTWSVAVWMLFGTALAWSGDGDKPQPAGPVLLLPGGQAPFRLKLEVLLDGASPSVLWNDFLDRLFVFFDRDGDGSLNQAEVSRMFPLPLPGGKDLLLPFARLDADGNGKVSRAELKAFCRSNGFGPILVVLEPTSADDPAPW